MLLCAEESEWSRDWCKCRLAYRLITTGVPFEDKPKTRAKTFVRLQPEHQHRRPTEERKLSRFAGIVLKWEQCACL